MRTVTYYILYTIRTVTCYILYTIRTVTYLDRNFIRVETYQAQNFICFKTFCARKIFWSEFFFTYIHIYIYIYIYIYYYLKKFCKSLTVAYASIVWVFGQNQGFRWLFKKFLTLIYVSVKSIIDEYFFFESIALKGLVWRIFIRVNKNQYWYFSVIWFYSFKIQFYN